MGVDTSFAAGFSPGSFAPHSRYPSRCSLLPILRCAFAILHPFAQATELPFNAPTLFGENHRRSVCITIGFMIKRLFAVAVALVLASASSAALPLTSKTSTILYLPIDERYATRGMFLNLASSTTPYEVLTPPDEIICFWKRAGVSQYFHATSTS